MARVAWREVVVCSLLILGGLSIHTESDAAELAAAPVALKSVPAKASADKKPQPLKAQVAQLLELGSKSTPQAIEAAKARYEALHEKTSGDARVEYAYGLVLVQQHRYADANRQLAAIVKAHPTDVHAWRLKIWAQMLQKSYDGALGDMQRLAKHYPQDGAAVAAVDDEFLQDTAFLIGQMCGYLEGPRAEVVKKLELKRANERIQDAIGPTYWGSFVEGRTDVAQRFAQAQRELEQVTATDRAAADKKKLGVEKRIALENVTLEKRQGEVEQKAESLATDWAEIKQIGTEIENLRDRLAIVDVRAAMVSSQANSVLQQRQVPLSQQNNSRPARLSASETQALNAQLGDFNRSAASIKLQISVLRARQTALLARQQFEGATLERRAAELRKADKQLQSVEKKLKYEREPAKSTDARYVTTHMRSLAAYEEFQAEDEHAYVLDRCKTAKSQ